MLFPDTDFSTLRLPESLNLLRDDIRQFLDKERRAGSFTPHLGHGEFDVAFSKKLGERGWIGMTWPKKYGGHERTYLERFVVMEELFAAAAPVHAHWNADRQIGPSLLRWGTEEQRQRYVPAMARGECCFAIGMSEPNAGSDLASVRTHAEQVRGGWKLNGQKTWTSWAHKSEAMFVLCRTSPLAGDRHEGLSQLIVDLSSSGITIRPVRFLDGVHRFNDVFFEDVFVPDDRVLGKIGQGWLQVTSELALERSGPERYMNTFLLFCLLLDALKQSHDRLDRILIGTLTARFASLRRMSLAIAHALSTQAKTDVGTEAALVKDIGTLFERDIVEAVRTLTELVPIHDSNNEMERLFAEASIFAPIPTIRGGTTQILRGIIARRLEAAL
ncbi:MAG: acyl-CoA dehydrogenase family protein [Betaproteobacteria bacterium]|nr:acyl-CoA dehydrogenase family protein [Betaproteobacteria bacterium]